MADRKIITDYIHPPIPVRCNDWQAYREGDDGDDIFGWGATEEEAIADLIEQEAELLARSPIQAAKES